MPERTCIGCRRRKDQKSLIRIARDAMGHLALCAGFGRGAYVCPAPECIAEALTKGRLERALKQKLNQAELGDLQEELCKLR